MSLGIVASSYVSTSGGGGSDYETLVLSYSPGLYLRLGESSGSTAADSSGNNRDGTYQNSPTLGATGLVSGDADTAATFNGSSQYVTVPQTGGWLEDYSFTAFCLVNASSTSGTELQLFGKSDDSAWPNVDWFVGMTNGQLHFFVNQGGSYSFADASATISTSTTYFAAVTYNNPNMVLRVYDADGIHATGANTLSKSSWSTNNFSVAARANGARYFPGTIDEVVWIPSVLSTSELDELAGVALTGTGF